MNIRKIAAGNVFRTAGWRLVGAELAQTHRRAVVTAAPHTSNWDLLFSLAAFELLDVPVRFTIKREWMKFPWKIAIEPLGGIAIDRSPQPDGAGATRRPSMVEAMVRLFRDHPSELAIMVTPEGTRGARDAWKTGFWHVAKQAGVPILLGYLDYRKKEAGLGAVIEPTDLDTDMRRMMAFYANVTGRHPELFKLDKRYAGPAEASDS